MFGRKSQKMIVACLSIAIIVGVAAIGMNRQAARAADPFAEMIDEYLAASGARAQTAAPREKAIHEAAGTAGVIPDVPDVGAGKTDRYIVKYKDGRGESFEQKLAPRLGASLDILPEIHMGTGNLSVQGSKAGTAKARAPGNGETAATDVRPESAAAQNTKLIILSEPMLPSEFAAEIKALGASGDIEYIQPDFELCLDSLGLTLLDDGGAGPSLQEGGKTPADSPVALPGAEDPAGPVGEPSPEEGAPPDGGAAPDGEAAHDEGAENGGGAPAGENAAPDEETTIDDDAAMDEDGALGPGGAGAPEDGVDPEGEGPEAEEIEDGDMDDGESEGEDIEDEEAEDGETEEDGEPEEDASPEQTVLVAVIDTGVDTGHEIFEGYLYHDAPDTETDLLSYAHGTHVSGIIVNTATGAGADIALLPIRVFDNGNAYTSDVIAAVYYATACGAQIVNCSFGSTAYNQALYEAISESDALFVCAVGNNRRDFDAAPSYPAGYGLPNVVSVASTNYDDGFSYYSNYGHNSIDIAAVGRDVYSSLPGNIYGTQSGTSMSAAYVTGVAASMLSQGSVPASDLKGMLIASADMLSNLQNKVVDGRRINLENALAGAPGGYIVSNPPEDFDVHGYQRTDEENWELFSSLSFTQVSAGEYHSLALASDGTVWAWGKNNSGQLGDGGNTPQEEMPVQVVGLTNVIAISAGYSHNLALKGDSTVWAWGCNTYGQLGDGTYNYRYTPVQVMGMISVTAVSAAQDHSLAMKGNGMVFGWGANWYGQLGVDSAYMSDSDTPIPIMPLNAMVAIAAGEMHNMALRYDGVVFAWGANWFGQLGDGSGVDSPEPIQVSSLADVTAISAGQYHSLALKNDGSVWGWGANWYGQLGADWNNVSESYAPIQVAGLANAVALSAGWTHSLAIKSDGTAWGWGGNDFGELGDGTNDSSYMPVQASALTNVTAIAAGYHFSLAAKLNNTAWAWGWNCNGQLGNGGWYDSGIPVLVGSFSGGFPAGAGIDMQVTSGDQKTIAVTAADIGSFAGSTITVTYDPSKLQLLDAACQVYGTYTAIGAVPGTGITVTSVSPGAVELTFDVDIPPGKTWSGTVTVISFKAVATGTASISVAM